MQHPTVIYFEIISFGVKSVPVLQTLSPPPSIFRQIEIGLKQHFKHMDSSIGPIECPGKEPPFQTSE